MSDIWLQIIAGALTIIGAIITYVLVPLYKEKTTAEQQANIEYWVNVAVAAAEQLMQDKTGKDKKAFVLIFLRQKGIKIDAEQLDTLIEAAVYHLKN